MGDTLQPYKLDAADRRILRELQQDGSLRNDVLAERIALTPAPTLRRVRVLEAAGVIKRYVALLEPERIGLGVRVKVDVRLSSQTRDAIDAFSKSVSAMPEVLECMILFGEWDFQLAVVAQRRRGISALCSRQAGQVARHRDLSIDTHHARGQTHHGPAGVMPGSAQAGALAHFECSPGAYRADRTRTLNRPAKGVTAPTRMTRSGRRVCSLGFRKTATNFAPCSRHCLRELAPRQPKSATLVVRSVFVRVRARIPRSDDAAAGLTL